MSKPYTGDRNLLIGVIIFAVLLAGFFTWSNIKRNKDESTPGIADFHAGHYKIAIQKLDLYLIHHPCAKGYNLGQSQVAEQYLGKAYLNDHQNQKAIDTLNNPCIFDSHNEYWTGVALMDQGKLNEARTAFRRSQDMSTGKSDEKWLEAADEKIEEMDYAERHPRK